MSLEGWDAVADVPYKRQLQAEYAQDRWRQRERALDALEQLAEAEGRAEIAAAKRHAYRVLGEMGRRPSAKTEARQQ